MPELDRMLLLSGSMKPLAATLSALLAFSTLACGADDPIDGEFDDFPTGKADGGIDPGSP